MTTSERVLFFTIIVIIGLFFGLLIKTNNERQHIEETFEKDFDKVLKKAFLCGWLTGANQMRDFGNCYVSRDTLMIMLQKDTSDFSYSIESINNGN